MAKKKGFMTPERKKKLRTLLRKKAVEELKKEQERKAAERDRVINERCGAKKDFEAASIDDLKKICTELFDKGGGPFLNWILKTLRYKNQNLSTTELQSGAAGCEKGLVKCLLKVPLACLGSMAAAVQHNGLCNSQKTIYNTFSTTLPPQTVDCI